jgi:molecular chaperone GrpE
MSKKINKDWKSIKEKHDENIQIEEALMKESAPEDELGALSHPSYTALEEKLTLAEQQAHENWEKSVRAMAEVDNIRRRAERDIAHAHRYSLEKFSTALLPIVDSLEQALQLADKDHNTSMREGLELTMKLFLDLFKKFDVHQLDPLGEAFDPQQHEAMAMQESSDTAPNSVLMVIQKGYKLNDRVIRPARVIVAKEKTSG